jgi:hypothetical protein
MGKIAKIRVAVGDGMKAKLGYLDIFSLPVCGVS